MEDLSRILHDLDQGNTNVTDAKKLVLDLFTVSGRFSDNEVRNIVLEMKNAALYSHSHNHTRFELQAKLREVKKKWKLTYR